MGVMDAHADKVEREKVKADVDRQWQRAANHISKGIAALVVYGFILSTFGVLVARYVVWLAGVVGLTE